MELRKCCQHPFLIRGYAEREVFHTGISRTELMLQCSGKMVLLDKLLSKLRSQGNKVGLCMLRVR